MVSIKVLLLTEYHYWYCRWCWHRNYCSSCGLSSNCCPPRNCQSHTTISKLLVAPKVNWSPWSVICPESEGADQRRQPNCNDKSQKTDFRKCFISMAEKIFQNIKFTEHNTIRNIQNTLNIHLLCLYLCLCLCFCLQMDSRCHESVRFLFNLSDLNWHMFYHAHKPQSYIYIY